MMKKSLLILIPLLLACAQGELNYQDAVKKLNGYVDRNIQYKEDLEKSMGKITLDAPPALSDALPPIDTFSCTVDPEISLGDVAIEIFVSTEKSGTTNPDNWMVKVAEEFNRQNKKTSSGKTIRIKVRRIASGDAFQYIYGKAYIPDAYSPSNHLWIKMVEARGITVTPISEKLVGNVAGIVMKKAVYNRLKAQYGDVDVKTVIEEVVKSVNDPENSFTMGYTDPFASSTGLNFLTTILAIYADGDSSRMLSPGVVSAFEAFQQGVPFVALTTLQMRESVENNGSLDAFVMEYQSFYNSEILRTNYSFIPFGLRHDNPLYALENPGSDKIEGLKVFAEYCKSGSIAAIAENYGFNRFPSYKSSFPIPPGNILVNAQKLWKEKKDSGRPIIAIFLSDVSGSMNDPAGDGSTALSRLKEALIEGGNFISPDNYIGLVEFNQEVTVRLPVQKFSINHRARFNGAINNMYAEGKTAMYDGILVALKLLVEAAEQHPNAKPILFTLSDGETNKGAKLTDIEQIIEGLGIPIYTIGYNTNLSELKKLSSLTEAASIDADEEAIRYKIGALLNAEM